MEIIRSLNWGTFYFFNFQNNSLPELRPLFQWGDLVGSYPVMVCLLLITVAMALLTGRSRLAGTIFLLGLLAVAMAEGLRFTLPSPGPAQPLEEVARSFPARPVFYAFFVFLNLALVLECLVPGRKFLLLIFNVLALELALWVTVSQLFLGLHFLTDVFAGMSGGIGLALLTRVIGNKKLEKNNVGQESSPTKVGMIRPKTP
jgi:hypothetical protein